jgi:hypothetical protein
MTNVKNISTRFFAVFSKASAVTSKRNATQRNATQRNATQRNANLNF